MTRTRTAEPVVACPVCKAEAKQSSMQQDGSMCGTCFGFLGPLYHGHDHGNFMWKVVTNQASGLRRAEHRPRGFWSGSIEVHETMDYWATHNTSKSVVKVEVRWGTGGRDGSLGDIASAKNFTAALDHAITLAQLWEKEREL